MARRTRRPTADTLPTESPEPEPAPATDQTGAELLEDRTRIIAGGWTGRRFSASVPGAVAGVFLMVALALGAGGEPAFEPTGGGHEGGTSSDTAKDGGADTDDKTGDPAGGYDSLDFVKDDRAPASNESTDGDKPAVETPDEPKPDATADTPDQPTTMELGLGLDGYAVIVEWSVCDFDGFASYKVVRSTDAAVSWPLGAGDVLVAAISDVTKTGMVDKTGSHGRTYFYRVFAVRSVDGAYVAECSSAIKSIKTPPAPEPKPAPQPQPGGFVLNAFLGEGHPVLEWSSCGNVDFTKFKIVRSLDGTVTWPTGDNDTLIGAMGPDGHKLWDKDAPGGKTLFYRVFCVKSTEAGYVVAAASNVDSVTTPAYDPPPPPVGLGLEASLTGEGVVLHWQECTSASFSFYKVVRSMNENPSYLPYTDGTQVIGVIENHSVTGLTDGDVASGQTWFYRVQAIGYWNGQKVVLGQTAVVAVTIP
jgi:hypothetical protein